MSEEEQLEAEMEAEMDALDEAMFGDGPVYDSFPQGRELEWSDHFLNDRESNAGPNVSDNTPKELLSEGFSEHEVATALIKKAEELLG